MSGQHTQLKGNWKEEAVRAISIGMGMNTKQAQHVFHSGVDPDF